MRRRRLGRSRAGRRPYHPLNSGESKEGGQDFCPATSLAEVYFQVDRICLRSALACFVDAGTLPARMFSEDRFVHKAPVRFDDLRIFSG